jgi:DNA-binding CsgD family transcriptional regulator
MTGIDLLAESVDAAVRDEVGTWPADDAGRSASPAYAAMQAAMSLFGQSGLGLVILDTQLQILAANAEFCHQLGGPDVSVTDRNFFDLLHPSVRQRLWPQLARVARGHARCVEMMPVRWARADGPADRVRPLVAQEFNGVAADFVVSDLRRIVVLIAPEKSSARLGPEIPENLLSELDARILEGIATGLTTVQLASQLYLSHQGIAYHIGAMMRRFDVANRTALASKAFAAGIFRMDCWPPEVLPDHIRPKAGLNLLSHLQSVKLAAQPLLPSHASRGSSSGTPWSPRCPTAAALAQCPHPRPLRNMRPSGTRAR